MTRPGLLPTDDPLEQEGPAVAPLALFLEEFEAGARAGQEHPEALCAEEGLAELRPRGPTPPPGAPQALTLPSGAGTKLRNSSTWPTASQSTKSSSGGCTFCACRKSRTTCVTLRPLDLGAQG